MAEENEVVEGAEEGQQPTNEPQYTETELRAMELGWMDEDQWVEEGHDKSTHRSAREFLERGEMIGKIRAAERELQQTKQAIDHLAKQQKAIYERGYETAIADLKAQRKAALQEGDVVLADELGDKIEETRASLNKVRATPNTPVQPQVDPEFYQWLEANSWYNDKVLQKFADSVGMEYVAQAQAQGSTFTNADVRDFVTKTVKKEFAHRFSKASERKVTGAPNPDGEGRTSGKERGNDTLSKVRSGLSEDERQIMKTIIRATGMSEAEYLKMYSSVQ